MKYYMILISILFSVVVNAQDNVELQKMADEDQKMRMSGQIDWKILNKEDSLRRIKVFQILKNDKLVTAKDYLNAGIIFQHGNDTISSSMAVKTFKKALELDPSLNKWWYAAAVDRDLMRRQQPQIYGTQFIKNKNTNGRWQRYNIDTTQITDEQRKYYRVETLAEQVEKERIMNLKSLSEFFKNEKSISQVLKLIKSEYKKGMRSEYNVNEDVINSFGYQLLNERRKKEALKIFKLNSILYPKGFNTFDSYGEVLLSMGKIKKALKNYRKSLELNPKNENAKIILEKYK